MTDIKTRIIAYSVILAVLFAVGIYLALRYRPKDQVQHAHAQARK